MFKKLSFTVLLSAILLIVTFTMDTSKAQAGYADNPNDVYYNFAKQAYNVDGFSTGKQKIQSNLNEIYGNKFKVIDTLSVVGNPFHEAARQTNGNLGSLDSTGLEIMTIVKEPSATSVGKVYFAFAGTDSKSLSDILTSKNIAEGDTPGQLNQIQLYLNYIYSNYPTYSGYQWYFTGHSLGGYLAAKTYLDIRSANWLTSTPWKYGGAVNKKTISGVYTFNPLPIPKNQISSTQWNANINKVYDSEIKNLYIENEWLNGVYDMHSDKMAYFGFKGAVPSSIPTYKTINYTPKGSISGDLAGYYAYSLTHKKAVTDNHGISALAPYVSN